MNAVITADIVDYTKLTKEGEEMVLQAIHKMYADKKSVRTNLGGNLSIKRGDSIQIELKNPSEALESALLLKTTVNKISLSSKSKTKPDIDIRIAIGIGTIHSKRDSVNESTGDAYTFSGRTLDAMKKQKRTIAIKTANEKLNAELDTELALLEEIMFKWTVNSAEVLYWKLLGLNEYGVSQQLKISQPAINHRKKHAGWNGIEILLERFEQLMEEEEKE